MYEYIVACYIILGLCLADATFRYMKEGRTTTYLLANLIVFVLSPIIPPFVLALYLYVGIRDLVKKFNKKDTY